MLFIYSLKGDEGDNQYGSPMSLWVITFEEPLTFGLKETPTDDMDRKILFNKVVYILKSVFLINSVIGAI